MTQPVSSHKPLSHFATGTTQLLPTSKTASRSPWSGKIITSPFPLLRPPVDMTTTTRAASTLLSDEQLWQESRAGNHDAFGRIVERYQSLVCSLAYSASGSLSR